MIEITQLQKSDRADWERLARGYNGFYETELHDTDYERAWRRLLAGKEIHGLAARHDGRLVGIAHFLFHSNIWRDEVCYLQDLFVDEAARGQGVARALIDAVAAAAKKRGASRYYWQTKQDKPAPARSMTSWHASAASSATTIRWSERRSEEPQHRPVQISPA
jgi:GNAT superfamily N-acetyltransferase